MKIISAQQAKISNIYKNTKLKLLKTNASIWFYKTCRMNELKLEVLRNFSILMCEYVLEFYL